MKILKNIFIFICEIILAIAIIITIMTNLISSTILDKEYVMSKFDETDYYTRILEYAETNFEKYINQSGLDEEVIENVITKEQVRSDTQKVISNIYDGNGEDIDTDEIRERLKSNIYASLGEQVADNNKETIDIFIETVCNEYLGSISHYKFEEDINKEYVKIVDAIKNIQKLGIIVFIVCIIVLLVFNLKEIYKFIAYIGTTGVASGISFLIINHFINGKIDVQSIMLLNEAFSDVIKNVVAEVLNTLKVRGILLLILGIIFIIVPTFIHIAKDTPENEQAD